ncbi:hypothetical protein FRX31_012512 [Thalictrum thalictroides]|uniref:Reverse transcriptase zinc-binding domain-containing protein n=1 Tax=Thalictrum thalictroides TaxID=46969 RepID=A0A7J6WKI8_THATH|nr:hypothetical protein FRX31_012512 [Thalictrum thalictroides]
MLVRSEEIAPHCEDASFWPFNTQGKLTTSSAFSAIRGKLPKPHWSSFLWSSKAHPRVGTLAWKLLQGAMNTDNALQRKKKVQLASRVKMSSLHS